LMLRLPSALVAVASCHRRHPGPCQCRIF
jgi:hypothetical protein